MCVRPQEGNEVDKYNLNHPKLIHRPFMTLYIMVVGKFYDNFHDLPAQQNHFNLYKNDDEDDPVAWAPAVAATSTKTMPKVWFTFFLSLKSSWLHFDFLMNLLGCHNSIFKIDLMYYIVQPKLVLFFHFLSFLPFEDSNNRWPNRRIIVRITRKWKIAGETVYRRIARAIC